MNKLGKYIVIESWPNVDKTLYINKLIDYFASKKKLTNHLESLHQYNDPIISALNKIEAESNKPINFLTNLYLYLSVQNQALLEIERNLNKNITSIVENNYVNLLSQIYGKYYVSDDYDKYIDLIINNENYNKIDTFIFLDFDDEYLAKKISNKNYIKNMRLFIAKEISDYKVNVIRMSGDLDKDLQKIVRLINNSNKPTLSKSLNIKIKMEYKKIKSINIYNLGSLSLNTSQSIKTNNTHQFSHLIEINKISNLLADNLINNQNIIGINAHKVNPLSDLYIPTELNGKIKMEYIKTMDVIFERFVSLTKMLGQQKNTDNELITNSLTKILPLASSTKIHLLINQGKIKRLIEFLSSENTLEAKTIIEDLAYYFGSAKTNLKEIHQKVQLSQKNITLLTNNLLGNKYDSFDNKNVILINSWPKNEFNAIENLAYKYTNLSSKLIKTIFSKYDYDQNIKLLDNYISNDVYIQESIENFLYEFEVLLSNQSLNQLISLCPKIEFISQPKSLRFGFSYPSILKNEKHIDLFEQNYSDSLKLNSLLIKNTTEEVSNYSILYGHISRTRIKISLSDIKRINQLDIIDEELIKCLSEMTSQIKLIHPNVLKS